MDPMVAHAMSAVILLALVAIYYRPIHKTGTPHPEDHVTDHVNIAIFVIAHAAITALSGPVIAMVGILTVLAIRAHPIRFIRRLTQSEAAADRAGDATDGGQRSPEGSQPSGVAPGDDREPVPASGGGEGTLTAAEAAAWEDLTSSLRED